MVGLDEAHFCCLKMKGEDEILVDFVKRVWREASATVIITAVDTRFDRTAIAGVLNLVPMASLVQKIPGYCTACGHKTALYSVAYARKVSCPLSADTALVGGKEKYGVICQTCYMSCRQIPLSD